MLQAEGAPPRGFQQNRVIDAVSGEIEDSTRDCVRLSVRFKDGIDAISGTSYNACTACGSCFTGCPYNAKNSVDKNYIAAAIEAGCTVRTNCEVRFVLPNFNYGDASIEDKKSHGCPGCKVCHGRRRWRIYLDETDYITADFVVISAGVLGTTNILLQSKIRGLALSDKLGHGFSCNGNSVAFVCGTHVATKANSLSKKELNSIPMFDRPGPSITTSYTSSLGFTIQGAVLANGFSFIFFKCIAHRGFWFGLLYGIWHKIKHLLKARNSDSLIFNMMGHDAADGHIEFDLNRGLVRFFPPTDSLIPKKINTVERIVKRIGGQLFMPTLRNTTVHLLGGCRAGGSAVDSVTNPDGQVFHPLSCLNSSSSDASAPSGKEIIHDVDGLDMDNRVHDGLYVCDASIIPCAVGVNPSFTITTVAEHVAKSLVQDAVNYHAIKEHEEEILIEQTKKTSRISDQSSNMEMRKAAAGVRVWETLCGRVEGLPCTLEVVMDMGSAETRDDILKGRVGGKFRMRALENGLLHIIDGTVDMHAVNKRAPYTQYMHYKLYLVSETGAMYEMNAKKEMKPFLMGTTAWTESRTLEIELRLLSSNFNLGSRSKSQNTMTMRGTVQVSFLALLRSAMSMKGPRRWQFSTSLILSLLRTYLLPTPRFSFSSAIVYSESPAYPQHTVHNITTDDGVDISCWQWLPTRPGQLLNTNEQHMSMGTGSSTCVLLLNGYSGESYCLPTEENDLVRTLLNEGYEVWVLQMRLHFSVCTPRPFSLDDIAKFDLSAAFSKIVSVRGKQSPIHVVAHCIGGLTIHMALLGGHVPISSVASLTCTNSSMFFDVTKLAMVKLFLPLIPISINLLGGNNILQFSDSPSESWRHKLLKKLSGLIPCVEHCTYRECNLFSGIFGNAFWHENLTERLHAWLSKETLVKLPADGFRQLRRICMAGNVISSNGDDKYMPYIGRLAVSTTYISGGRPILVTPTTSERAHALMQHYHPEFRHTRHVVHGYGHSDLHIAETSARDVFPLILESIAKSGRITDSRNTSSDIQRRTWAIPSSQATAFLLRLRIFCFILVMIVIFACFY